MRVARAVATGSPTIIPRLRRGLFISLLFLAYSVAGPNGAVAQERGRVTGRVTDPNDTPLPGASLVFENTTRGGATNNNGRYTVTAPSGAYTLRASYLGYRSKSVAVVIPADSAITVNFILSPDLLQMEEAVRTGTFNPYAKLESTVAITTLSTRDIQTESPQSTADLLKAVPGFYVESSGGEGENNLFARGLPADGSYRYVGLQEDGTQIYEASALDFANPDNFIRLDATVERVEAVRGGSASTFVSDAPGGLVNFVSKTGGPQWEGLGRLTVRTDDLIRGDVNVGGPLSDALRMNVGGFYRYDEGLRNPGFPANQGGQVKGSLTWQTDRGHVRLFGKYLNDRTIFYLPVPYRNPDNPSSIPGFDLRTGTLTTDDAKTVTVPDPSGAPVTRDLQDGIHPIVRTGGAELLVDLGRGWTLHNTTRLTDIDHTFTAIVSLQNPVEAGVFADSALARASRSGVNATQARYRRTTSGEVVDDPSSLNGNGLVVETGWWYNEKPLTHVANELEVSRSFGDHDLTATAYVSRFTSDDFRHWHDLLTEVDERPDRLDLELLNPSGTVVSRATNRGFGRLGSNYVNHEGTGWVTALHLGDRWDLGRGFYVELGTRLQRAYFSGEVETVERIDLDGQASTLFDAQFQTGTGQFLNYDHTFDEWAATAGLNYRFDDHFALFARGSRGFRMPNFDQWIASALDEEPGIEKGTSERVWQVEGGVKYSAEGFALFASGFFIRLDEIPFNDQVVGSGGQTVIVQNFGRSRTIGTEIEMSLQPSPAFQVTMRSTIQNPVFTELSFVDPQDGELDFDGNRVKRIPIVMFSAKPTYSLGRLSLHGTWAYVGDRFANNRNTFTLPEYSIVDLGTALRWRGATLSAQLNNVFGSIGLTEGNPRVDETLSEADADAIDVFMGRPVLPRSLQLSLTYHL